MLQTQKHDVEGRERGRPVDLLCSSSSSDPSGAEDVLNPENDAKGREKREEGSASSTPDLPLLPLNPENDVEGREKRERED
jgi:hypothetical protein